MVLIKNFLGLLKRFFGLVHASNNLPEWQAVKPTLHPDRLFKNVWRTTKTSHLPFYLFSVNKKLTFTLDCWWKKSIQSPEVSQSNYAKDLVYALT